MAAGAAEQAFAAALTLQAAGAVDEAAAAYRRVLALAPDAAAAFNNLGNLLAETSRPAEALAAILRATRLFPDQAQPHANLGAVLVSLDQPDEAAAACRRALVLAPANHETANNLGNALVELNRLDAAAEQFRRAIRLKPDFAEACLNFSGLVIDGGGATEGASLCRRAVVVDPGGTDGHNNLANALSIGGRLAEAEAAFRRALTADPANAQAHYNLASVLLKRGRLIEGWAEYEWRLVTEAALATGERFDRPTWDGGPLDGRTILLWAEQGHGDVIQFCRYAPLVAARGGRVVLRVYPPLVRLLSSLDHVAEVVAVDAPLPPFDCQISLMSLPHRFATDLDSIPAGAPYLRANPVAVAMWRNRLASLPGRKVGVVWAGDPRPRQRGAHLLDRRRSLPLSAFAGLAEIAGVRLVSLQKGAPADQARPPPFPLFDATGELADFADTAALVDALDIVVTVDTAIAHLAGALGKSVWILSRFDGCWRWLDGRDDSPWYRTARLFRQDAPGDWGPALARLTRALRDQCGAPEPMPTAPGK
jgi:tetratricopeptide (TPR) repeat protein